MRPYFDTLDPQIKLTKNRFEKVVNSCLHPFPTKRDSLSL